MSAPTSETLSTTERSTGPLGCTVPLRRVRDLRGAFASIDPDRTGPVRLGSFEHDIDPEQHQGTLGLAERPWIVILYDDPVNICEYVTKALVAVLQVEHDAAEALMFKAHDTGRAVVFEGSREQAVTITAGLLAWHLTVTLEQAR